MCPEIIAGILLAGLVGIGLCLYYVKRQVRQNRIHFDERLRTLHGEMVQGDRTTYTMTVKRVATGLDAIEKEVANAVKVRRRTPRHSNKKR